MRSRRAWVGVALLSLVALLSWDLTRSPQHQITARLLIGGIDLYQATLSRAMPSLGVRCRFEPTCSRYTEVSIRRHGTVRGSWKGLTRLARCGPWTPAGTVDPP